MLKYKGGSNFPSSPLAKKVKGQNFGKLMLIVELNGYYESMNSNDYRILTASRFSHELTFITSRSGGPGGQNVNKVNSKVTLQFDIGKSQVLTEEEKETLFKKLASQITKEGLLMISAQDSRSQLQNKETVIAKFEKLLSAAFKKKKVRKATKPSKGSVMDRIKQKKQRSEKKKWRQKPL